MAVRRQANFEGVQKGYKGGTKGVQEFDGSFGFWVFGFLFREHFRCNSGNISDVTSGTFPM